MMLYLGIEMDYRIGAMAQLAEFQTTIKSKENEKASNWSGQSGISAQQLIWLKSILNSVPFEVPVRELMRK